MTDLRQGVTPAVHDVLDELDRSRSLWNEECLALTFERQLGRSLTLVENARSGDLLSRRREAIAAAARLLSAIEKIDEEGGEDLVAAIGEEREREREA